MTKIRPVILSGGSGSRLWPVSRTSLPKQFADIYEDVTLFGRTLDLISDRSFFDAPLIVANKQHKFLILEQLEESNIKDAKILLEPIGRNTAAAAIIATLADVAENDKPHLVLPSDHVITDRPAFYELVKSAKDAARDRFVLFGITPDRPETGYGYIEAGSPFKEGPARSLDRFVEKPQEDLARQLIENGALWNSGIFFYLPRNLLIEAQTLAPATLALCEQALKNSITDFGCVMLSEASYVEIDNIPFDRVIMEKTSRGAVVSGNFGWSDIGCWHALWHIGDKDECDNIKEGNIVAHDVHRSMLRSTGPMIAVMGVVDLTIVATKDAVLVMPTEKSQDIRALVASVEAFNKDLTQNNPKVLRPWGAYEGIAKGSRYQVKQITVLPGRSLSQQMHHHRAEHWIVVEGTAKIKCDDQEKLLFPNESVYIPYGAVHQLSNPGLVDLQLIEVQSGDYIGEDDIVRFNDKYGQTSAEDTYWATHEYRSENCNAGSQS